MEGLESEGKQVMYNVVQKEKAFVSQTEVNDKSGRRFRKLFDSNLQSGTRRNLK